MDRLSAFHSDQSLVQACIEVGQIVGWKTHQAQDRGMQMFDMEPIADSLASQLIGLAHTDPTLNATSGHPHGKTVGIVITPRAFGVFSGRLTTKFPSPDNECFIQ